MTTSKILSFFSKQAQKDLKENISKLTVEDISKIEKLMLDFDSRMHELIKDLILLCHAEPAIAAHYLQLCLESDRKYVCYIKHCLSPKQQFLMHPKTRALATKYQFELPVVHIKVFYYYMKDIVTMANTEESLLFKCAS